MVLGLVAGTLTTLSFLPQVIRTWRTKSAEDLSLADAGGFHRRSGLLVYTGFGSIRCRSYSPTV